MPGVKCQYVRYESSKKDHEKKCQNNVHKKREIYYEHKLGMQFEFFSE